ncbi:MAG: stage III sporulation protein AD [Angelakisella sp.]|nr:stage III sporulation protein AD [Angelakisella sp.]
MEITSLIVLCIAVSLLALSLRQQRPEYAMLLSLACGLFVLFFLVGKMGNIFSQLQDLMTGLSGQSELTEIVLKALGICIVAELGSQCCRDAGETAIATKVELAAKAALVLMSIPIFQTLLEVAGELLHL